MRYAVVWDGLHSFDELQYINDRRTNERMVERKTRRERIEWDAQLLQWGATEWSGVAYLLESTWKIDMMSHELFFPWAFPLHSLCVKWLRDFKHPHLPAPFIGCTHELVYTHDSNHVLLRLHTSTQLTHRVTCKVFAKLKTGQLA